MKILIALSYTVLLFVHFNNSNFTTINILVRIKFHKNPKKYKSLFELAKGFYTHTHTQMHTHNIIIKNKIGMTSRWVNANNNSVFRYKEVFFFKNETEIYRNKETKRKR